MPSSEPFVSVVTPFYDTAAYLEECIESVLAQDYRNFEYILVDNQSKDGSTEIAKSYVGKDARIRYVRTPKFFTQLQNYNFTMSQVSRESRFVKMVNADDWVFPRCLSEMVALGVANPQAGVISGYELQGTQVFGTGLYPTQTVISGREACRLFLLKGVCMFGSPNTVMYRADLVRRQYEFYREEKSLHSDTETVFELLKESDFGFVHQVCSYTRLRPESISGVVAEFSPAALDLLILVKRHGRAYLDEAEYESTLRNARGWLYGSLVRKGIRGGFSQGTRRDFIRYQMEGLDMIDEKIEPTLVVKHLAAAAASGVLEPLGVLHVAKSVARLARRQL